MGKKAFAGGLRTKGKVCMECGQHCVNGVASMIFSAVVYIAALVVVLLVYFKGNSNWDYVYMVGAVAAAFVLCRLFDAFLRSAGEADPERCVKLMGAGLYLHVPFCRRKCPYCNFYSVPAQPELLTAYTAAVCRNLRHYGNAAQPERVDTVYFGGGTPSLLPPAQITQILETAAEQFALSADAEITLEANPATVTPEAAAGTSPRRHQPAFSGGCSPCPMPS